jgi:hypothetical protein
MVGKSVAEKALEKRAKEVLAQPEQTAFDFAALNRKWMDEARMAKDGSLDATITNMTVTNAGAVYGDKAKDPERSVISVEITASDGKTFTETFSMPDGAGSWRNKQFKLGIFLAKYGNTPEIGMAVKVAFNEEGFYRLAM